MSEAGTCSPHDSHVGEGAKRSCPNQGLGSDGGSTPVTSHNAGSQHLSEERASSTSPSKGRRPKSFDCYFPVCRVTFTTSQARNRHYKERHGGVDTPRFPCPFDGCPYESKRKHDLERHFERMHGHYDYVATEAATADEAAPAAVEVEDYDGLLEIGQHNGPMVLHVITDAVSREDALPTENINTFPPVDSTTADIPPNLGMIYSSAFSSPIGGHCTSPVSGDPMVEQSGSIDPYRGVDYVISGQTPSTPSMDAAPILTNASSWLY